MTKKNDVSIETEERSPMASLLMRLSQQRRIDTDIRSMAIMRRGVCTFDEKAGELVSGGASVGIMVNTPDGTMELPIVGREDSSKTTVPFGIIRESDGSLVFLTAARSDVYAILSDPRHNGLSPACTRLHNIAEEVLDKWPHSVPFIPMQQLINYPEPSKRVRGRVDEGGRIAISGTCIKF